MNDQYIIDLLSNLISNKFSSEQNYDEIYKSIQILKFLKLNWEFYKGIFALLQIINISFPEIRTYVDSWI